MKQSSSVVPRKTKSKDSFTKKESKTIKTSEGKKATKQFSGDEDLLLFVPSKLKNWLAASKINTVTRLVNFDYSAIKDLQGFGEARLRDYENTVELYERLNSRQRPDHSTPLGEFVPGRILPAKDVLTYMPISAFLLGHCDLNLGEENLVELHGLRMLLGLRYIDTKATKQLDELEWRDVPLKFPKRVDGFLDENKITTVGQLAYFATHCATLNPTTGKVKELKLADKVGPYSLANVGLEVVKLRTMGIKAFRGNSILLDDDFDCPMMDWREIPLRIDVRIQQFLNEYEVKTVSEVNRITIREQVYSKKNMKWLSLPDIPGVSFATLDILRRELAQLSKLGLNGYKFGNSPPTTPMECVDMAMKSLDPRQAAILKSRFSGKTLGDTGASFQITGERVRCIVESALESLSIYRKEANRLVTEIIDRSKSGIYLSLDDFRASLDLPKSWKIHFFIALADSACFPVDSKTLSRVPDELLVLLKTSLKQVMSNCECFDIKHIKTVGDLSDAFAEKFPELKQHTALETFREYRLSDGDLRRLIGKSWLKAFVKSQLVAAGVNFLSFKEIRTGGLVKNADDLEATLGAAVIRMSGDRFRRPGSTYGRAVEIVEIIRASPNPITPQEIIEKSKYDWIYSVLYGRYLLRINEVARSSRAHYIHISKLGLTLADVKELGEWAARVLAEQNETVAGDELLRMLKASRKFPQIKNANELLSIVSKNCNVRRLTCSIAVEFRDTPKKK